MISLALNTIQKDIVSLPVTSASKKKGPIGRKTKARKDVIKNQPLRSEADKERSELSTTVRLPILSMENNQENIMDHI